MASPQFDYRLSVLTQQSANCRLDRISNRIVETPEDMASRVDEVYELQARIDAERWAKQLFR